MSHILDMHNNDNNNNSTMTCVQCVCVCPVLYDISLSLCEYLNLLSGWIVAPVADLVIGRWFLSGCESLALFIGECRLGMYSVSSHLPLWSVHQVSSWGTSMSCDSARWRSCIWGNPYFCVLRNRRQNVSAMSFVVICLLLLLTLIV